MISARNIFTVLFILFFTIAILGGLFWADLNFARRISGGADFIVSWKAMQNFMLDGVTPYGELTSLNIQTIIYKRPLLPGENPYYVNTPFFLLMLYLPLAWIKDITLARAIWLIILQIGLFGVVFVCLRLAHWKPYPIFLIFILLFSAFWSPAISMIVTSTAIILQTFFIYLALRCFEIGSDELGGSLLALCFLNIEATGLVLLALIIWIFSTRRWRIIGGMLMMFTILFAVSLLLFPSWIFPFIRAAYSNWQSDIIPSTYKFFESWMPGIGHKMAQILAICALSILLIEWRAVRGQNIHWLFWTASLTAAITPLLGIPYMQHWSVFTLPGLLLVVSAIVKRWKLLGYFSSTLILVGIFSGLWAAQINGIAFVFILIYPLMLILLLYWVRWGAVNQPRLWVDEIKLRG